MVTSTMSDAVLVLGGRSQKEKEVFGGEVTVVLDGKVVGVLQDNDIEINVSSGTHTIRMSKSHEYGTQIGYATETVEVHLGDKLLIKYTPPLLVNAPGVIMVSDYIGKNLEQRLQEGQDTPIVESIAKAEHKKAVIRERNSNYNAIFIGTIILIAIVGIVFAVQLSHIGTPVQ